MTHPALYTLIFAVGLFFAVHCTRESLKEFRSGNSFGGKYGDYDRATSPFGFWFVMAGNVSAAVMGILFAVFGAIGLLAFIGVLK